jgi:hypothetical protein
VRGDRSDPERNHLFKKVGEVDPAGRAELLKKYIVGSIHEANEKRLSLAVVQPSFGAMRFRPNLDSPDFPSLFEDIKKPVGEGSKRFPYIPYLTFWDDGGQHDLQIRDWGCYEWMRKYPDRYQEIQSGLHLSDSSSLLIGNMNGHRNTWLIISVLNGLKTNQMDLFDNLVAS